MVRASKEKEGGAEGTNAPKREVKNEGDESLFLLPFQPEQSGIEKRETTVNREFNERKRAVRRTSGLKAGREKREKRRSQPNRWDWMRGRKSERKLTLKSSPALIYKYPGVVKTF